MFTHFRKRSKGVSLRPCLSLFALLFCLLYLAGCGSSRSSFVFPDGQPQPPVQIEALEITPSTPSVSVGGELQLQAEAFTASGSSFDVTSQASWSSNDIDVAQVSQTGLLTGVSEGPVQVTATFQGVSATVTVTVTDGEPVPEFASIQVNSTFTSARAVPSGTNEIRLLGRDANANVIYGPATQTLAESNLFENVPVAVTQVTLEYLANGAVIGSFTTNVTLVSGETFVIDDPEYVDADLAPTSLAFGEPLVDGIVDRPLPTFTVVVRDQFGNPVASGSPEVTAAVNGGGAGLAGTTTQTAVNGVATFDDLTYNQTGSLELIFTCASTAPIVGSVDLFELSTPVDTGESFHTLFYGFLQDALYLFPDYAFVWDLDGNFNIDDGPEDTFDDAMELFVDGNRFSDGDEQEYSELTWLTPLVTVEDKLPLPVVSDIYEESGPSNGSAMAYLPPAAATRISQTVTLTNATPIELSWHQNVETDGFNLIERPFEYTVTVRDLQGVILATAFQTNSGDGESDETFDLTPYAGQTVQIVFEARLGGDDSDDTFQASIDDVSILDDVGTELVVNGDFETGDLTGWTAETDPESQHLMSGARTMSDLEVTRTVFTRPDVQWIRYLDRFTNNTGAPITVDLRLETNAGSSDNRYYFVEGSGERAVSHSNYEPDDASEFAMVYGNADEIVDGPNAFNDDDVEVHFNDVTVEPGQTVTLISFLIVTEDRAYGGRPLKAERLAREALFGLGRSFLYTQGLTEQDLAQAINFDF